MFYIEFKIDYDYYVITDSSNNKPIYEKKCDNLQFQKFSSRLDAFNYIRTIRDLKELGEAKFFIIET